VYTRRIDTHACNNNDNKNYNTCVRIIRIKTRKSRTLCAYVYCRDKCGNYTASADLYIITITIITIIIIIIIIIIVMRAQGYLFCVHNTLWPPPPRRRLWIVRLCVRRSAYNMVVNVNRGGYRRCCYRTYTVHKHTTTTTTVVHRPVTDPAAVELYPCDLDVRLQCYVAPSWFHDRFHDHYYWYILVVLVILVVIISACTSLYRGKKGRGTNCRFDDYLCPSRVAPDDCVTPTTAILFEIRGPIAPAVVTVLYYASSMIKVNDASMRFYPYLWNYLFPPPPHSSPSRLT